MKEATRVKDHELSGVDFESLPPTDLPRHMNPQSKWQANHGRRFSRILPELQPLRTQAMWHFECTRCVLINPTTRVKSVNPLRINPLVINFLV